jgi:hypothetical protein
MPMIPPADMTTSSTPIASPIFSLIVWPGPSNRTIRPGGSGLPSALLAVRVGIVLRLLQALRLGGEVIMPTGGGR